MINMQQRELLEMAKSNSHAMTMTALCLQNSHDSNRVVHLKVYMENKDNSNISPNELRNYIESLYYAGKLQAHDDMSDELYLVLVNKYYNREIVIEITQDGQNGHLTRYATVNY